MPVKRPAHIDGTPALTAHDEANDRLGRMIVGTSAGALKVSGSTGKKTFTYDGNGRVQTIAIESEVNGATVTETYTFTYNVDGRIEEISAAVVS